MSWLSSESRLILIDSLAPVYHSMRLSILLLLLAVSSSVSAKRTILSGIISRKDAANTVSLYYYPDAIAEVEGTKTSLSVPLANKHYRFELDIDHPIKVYLQNGAEWLNYENYIAPGDSLVLSYTDSSEVYDGNCGDCNYLLKLKQDHFYGNPVMREYNQNAKSLPPEAFKHYITQFRETAFHLLDSFSKGTPLPEDFKRYYRAHADYYHYGVELAQYTWGHPELMQDPIYLGLLKRIELSNTEALALGGYVHFLRELPYAAWRSLYYKDGIGDSLKDYYRKNSGAIRASFARQYFSGPAYDVALYHVMSDKIKSLEYSKGSPAFDSLFEKTRTWIQSYQDSFSNKSYTQRLMGRMDALKAIEVAPEFSLKDVEGNTVHLSDFRGKVVYLDFWATSCAPCVKEIPYYQNLQQEFKDEQVVFLFVSIGDAEAPLKGFLKTRGFSGKHLMAPEGFGSEVARQYKISGLPKYVIVDRNGLIFSSDAPRPSGNPRPVLHAALDKM